MVKFFEHSFSHEYPFPTVTLAYFLRYPNPFSTHVVSTDVISSHFDPETQCLYTARLHLKRSKIPSAIINLIPSSLLGASTPSSSGHSQSYILERSIVAIRDGVMVTESKNLDLTSVLRVVERQLYRRAGTDLSSFFASYNPAPGFHLRLPDNSLRESAQQQGLSQNAETCTTVTTKVELLSRFGSATSRARRGWWRSKNTPAPATSTSPLQTTDQVPQNLEHTIDQDHETEHEHDADADSPAPKQGFWRSLSTSSVQRSIEAVGLRRAQRAVPKSKEGMNVVLERLRYGGLVAVLEGMRKDREKMDA